MVGDAYPSFMIVYMSQKVTAFKITYERERYCPGLRIEENGVMKIHEFSNAGDGEATFTKEYVIAS